MKWPLSMVPSLSRESAVALRQPLSHRFLVKSKAHLPYLRSSQVFSLATLWYRTCWLVQCTIISVSLHARTPMLFLGDGGGGGGGEGGETSSATNFEGFVRRPQVAHSVAISWTRHGDHFGFRFCRAIQMWFWMFWLAEAAYVIDSMELSIPDSRETDRRVGLFDSVTEAFVRV